MSEKKVVINKVPLKSLIELLISLYQDSHVDFIDILKTEEGEYRDGLHIGIRPEYINAEDADDDDDEDEDLPQESKQNPANISKEDFENLT